MAKQHRRAELRLAQRRRAGHQGKRGDEYRTPGSMNRHKSHSIKEMRPSKREAEQRAAQASETWSREQEELKRKKSEEFKSKGKTNRKQRRKHGRR